MPMFSRKFAAGIAAGAAVLATVAVAQPAAAITLPKVPFPSVSFYAARSLTGTQTFIDHNAAGECRNLAEPAKSGLNLSAINVEVYFNSDCRKGSPGTSSDLWYGFGTLSWANFPYPAASYRVRR